MSTMPTSSTIYTPEQLAEMLALHRKWRSGEDDGVRADLRFADLRDADLGDANLRDADLRFADLRGADLTDANLRGANLRFADLRAANLGDADLGDADLRDADLRFADLTAANLRAANLADIRDDLYRVLAIVPAEVPALLATLDAGRIDGAVYEGECACLVGTIANVRHCSYMAIPGLTPDGSRPAECWFLAIRPGDTPETSPIAAITAQWIRDWLAIYPAATAPAAQES